MKTIVINPCKWYVEDPAICDSTGEPKGQCLACGDKYFNHVLESLPTREVEGAKLIQEGHNITVLYEGVPFVHEIVSKKDWIECCRKIYARAVLANKIVMSYPGPKFQKFFGKEKISDNKPCLLDE